MKLYYSPISCSISSHIILQESGAEFDTQRVYTKTGGTRTPEYLKMNPKGKVPVLVVDENYILTETPVVLQFLAERFPEKNFLPNDVDKKFRVLETCEYLNNTVHNFALTRLFRPSYFSSVEDEWHSIRNEGRDVLLEAFDLMAGIIRSDSYIFGDFSIADAALFFSVLHANRLRIPMPAEVRAHFNLMLARPSVPIVLAREEMDYNEFFPDQAV